MKNFNYYSPILWVILACQLISCRKDKVDPAIDLSGIKQECITFNPTEIEIVGPVWMLKYQNKTILHCHNFEEAQEALQIIQANSINEQCKIGTGVYINPDGSENYINQMAYYYLSNGGAPGIALENCDCLEIDPSEVKSKRDGKGWLVLEKWNAVSGHRMHTFESKSDAESMVKVIHKFGFDNLCFVGRPHPTMNYYLKYQRTGTGK